ncbi:SLC13 family permease [Fusobacterium sp.]|uniref:SLC13 family permease n=1 Tax=Fusobacterium sp. TaxID=68766 RepID=UPI002900CBB5|nr:SLC13 family permease [Fusobacterium sp.]MDU1909589.1 anion permease [Fusobacterium sp.]
MTQTLKRNIYIAIAFVFIIFGRFMPLPVGMKPEGMTVLGIFLGSLLLWLTVAIDWPSLMCIAAIGMIPSIGFKNVFLSSFGNETFAFLMCTFMCTYVLSETPFLKRCALYFITSPMSKKGPWMFIISFLAAVITIGCFVSPTVLFVVFLPILEKIHEILGLKKGDKIGNMLMIGLTFCVSISAGMTPIAHVFSIMAMGFYTTATGLTIGYAQYMAFAIPVGLVCTFFLLLIFRFIINPDLSQIKNIDVSFLKMN